eukprot:snap_masked-scaffold_68-processed-gene-0.30-mRNA-1 protein AED:1.00 eAED:1.00 QI:0/-1/0/0/-1/1/1/0/77
MLIEKKKHFCKENDKKFEELFGKNNKNSNVQPKDFTDKTQTFVQEFLVPSEIVDYTESLEILSMDRIVYENFYGQTG